MRYSASSWIARCHTEVAEAVYVPEVLDDSAEIMLEFWKRCSPKVRASTRLPETKERVRTEPANEVDIYPGR